MNWNTGDNKHYTGPIDRVFVSDTESYEIHYYIDHWLETRGYAVNMEGRKNVAGWLHSYTGRAPHKRVDLDAYLDQATNSKKK
jgi:hypothetical protein